MARGASPAGRRRGATSRTASATARTWSGVVPQQPPRRFTKPLSANSRSSAAVSSGRSSYSPKALGRPAFGWQLTQVPATRASSARYGRMSRAPSAQLIPTEKGRACATETWNASMVCPESVRPLRSVMVTESIRGSSLPCSSNTSRTATIAALALSVSKIVSISSRSQPPSISARACSAYASRSASKVDARNV